MRFKTTDDLEPLEGTVGQERAVKALDFGLSIEADGFHVYVSGPPGTGRSTELMTQLRRIAAERPAPRDWCYVFNFKDPARPNALSLAPGRGHELGHDVEDFVAALRQEVPRAFESDEYAQRRDQAGREVQAQREQFFAALEREANARELTVNVTPMGINAVPLVDGKPITKEQFDALSEDRKQQIQQKMQDLDSVIAQMGPQLRRLDRGAQQLLAELDRQVMVALAQPRLDELKRDFEKESTVVAFLDALGADVIEHIDDFRSVDEAQRGTA
jgi:DNA polymerase III delta prime subunit